MRRLSTVLATLASLGIPLQGPAPTLAAGGYATSNAGIANVQASTVAGGQGLPRRGGLAARLECLLTPLVDHRQR